MSQRRLLSVIIPTCDRLGELAECLQRIAPQREDYEVIVSDDGRYASAKEALAERFPWVLWTEGPRLGPAANRNRGARLATGLWLVFTDDDTIPAHDWLTRLAEVAETTPALALEGAVEPLGTWRDMSECPANVSGGYYWTANMAVRRSLFERVGGFDEAYPLAAHEDEDLAIRLLEHTEIPFVRSAVVGHPVRQVGLLRAFRRIPESAAVWATYVAKNRERPCWPGSRSTAGIMLEHGAHFARLMCREVLAGRWRRATLALAEITVRTPLAALELTRRSRQLA